MNRPPRRRPSLARPGALLLLGCGVALLAVSCVRRPLAQERGIPAETLDRRVSLHTYLEEGALVSLGVSSEATRRREASPLVPLGLVVVNNGAPRLTINRESLVLVDDTGRRYPMASIESFKRVESRAVVDLQVSRRFGEIFADRFQAVTRIPSVFFPIPVSEPGLRGRGIVSDEIELPRGHWMIDVVYFPHPDGELVGRRYELWLAPPELEDPVFVRFAVE